MIELDKNTRQLSRAELESLYAQAISFVVLLARLLGKPCPIQTRAERRDARKVTNS